MNWGKKVNINISWKYVIILAIGIFLTGFILFGIGLENLGMALILFSVFVLIIKTATTITKFILKLQKFLPKRLLSLNLKKESYPVPRNENKIEPKTTKQCPHCKSEILLGAKKCPQCQSDLRSWFNRHPILTFLGICTLIGWMTIIIGSGAKKEGYIQKVAETPQQEIQQEIPIEISLNQLKAEYDANQLEADAKYKGKLLKFSAIIRNISKDIFGRPLVSLTTRKIKESPDIFSAVCYFKRGEESKLIGLKNGQVVTAIGRNDGMTLGILSFKDCNIE